MDPAEQKRALATQGALFGQHQQSIQALLDNTMAWSMSELSQQMAYLVSSGSSRLQLRTRQPQLRLRVPKTLIPAIPSFDRDLDKCRSFLLQHRLVFSRENQLCHWSVKRESSGLGAGF